MVKKVIVLSVVFLFFLFIIVCFVSGLFGKYPERILYNGEIPIIIRYVLGLGSITFVLSCVFGFVKIIGIKKRLSKWSISKIIQEEIDWFIPAQFSKKWRNYNFLLHSVTIALLSFGLVLSTIVLVLFLNLHSKDHISNPQKSTVLSDTTSVFSHNQYIEDQSHNFLFNVGLPIALGVILLSLVTYLNTEIIKKKDEIEIFDLDELLHTVADELYRTARYDSICNNAKKKRRFYYTIDHSMAVGQVSAYPDDFELFKKALRHFIILNDVTIKAITLPEESLEKKYSMLGRSNDDAKKLASEAKKLPSELCNHSMTCEGLTLRSKVEVGDEYKIKKATDDLIKSFSNFTPEQIADHKESVELECQEIGMYRLIVTDNFVIQFIAYHVPRDHGTKRNKPIAFYSQNRYTIEKHKMAFEQYLIELCQTKQNDEESTPN